MHGVALFAALFGFNQPQADADHWRAQVAVLVALVDLERGDAPLPAPVPTPTPDGKCARCNGLGYITHGDGHKTDCPDCGQGGDCHGKHAMGNLTKATPCAWKPQCKNGQCDLLRPTTTDVLTQPAPRPAREIQPVPDPISYDVAEAAPQVVYVLGRDGRWYPGKYALRSGARVVRGTARVARGVAIGTARVGCGIVRGTARVTRGVARSLWRCRPGIVFRRR